MGLLTGGLLTGAPDAETAPVQPITERIRAGLSALPPAERRVARVVLAQYPLAGLETSAALAGQAGVSAPTVLRLLARLGFEGWADFRRAMHAELAARLAGPAELYPQQPDGGLVSRVRAGIGAAVSAALSDLAPAELDAAVALLADARRPVWTVGGRWSGVLAQYLQLHLQLLRPGTHPVPPGPGGMAAALLDIDRRAVVVAFDYRRYQLDVVGFGRAAAVAGAAVVLFTDHLMSPLAAQARVVLTSAVEAGSPFTALTPGMAVVETLVARLVDELGGGPRARMSRYDQLSADVLSPIGTQAATMRTAGDAAAGDGSVGGRG